MSGQSSEYLDDLISAWRRMPTEFAEGLSESEFETIQARYTFIFPPDLRACLSIALPVGVQFPDWRTGHIRSKDFHGSNYDKEVAAQLRWPLEGMLFDVEENSFWRREFGPRPNTATERSLAVQNYFDRVPTLIPIYAHRFIAATPCEAGNPVLSVYQTDMIYYGEDLRAYIAREFSGTPRNVVDTSRIRRVSFWSDLIENVS